MNYICMFYLEDKYFPDMGLGFCLGEHDPKGNCKKCEDIIRTCPRKHTSPYLKKGEKA
jgi:hypothetical protein